MTDIEATMRRIREEFREMPGLHLTPAQAMRLWGLEVETCRRVIDELVAATFLRWTAGGAVTRSWKAGRLAGFRPIHVRRLAEEYFRRFHQRFGQRRMRVYRELQVG